MRSTLITLAGFAVILGYARTSTSKAEQSTSLKAQREQLKAAGCFRVVSEQRSAFKAGKRPGWEQCKEMIRQGLVSKFVVVSLSRASRRQETAEMSELCNEFNVEFEALSGGKIDVSTPEGFLNVTMQDGINKFDSMLKSVRVKQGMEARRLSGSTAIGRCPFGWKYDGTKPVPDPKQWKQARELWDELTACEFRANHVLRHGSKWQFSNSGLIRWMRNPILMGVTRYSDHEVEPLVTPEEFARCQQILDRRVFHRSRAPRQIRLFSGLVRCQGCDRFLNYSKGGHKWRLKCMYPSCEFYGCGLAEWKIRDQAIVAIRHAVDHRVEELAQQPNAAKLQKIDEEQASLSRKLQSLLEMQRDGLPGLDKAISDLRVKLRPALPVPKVDWTGLADLIRTPGVLESATDEELRPLFMELLDEIVYTGNPREVQIRIAGSPSSNIE